MYYLLMYNVYLFWGKPERKKFCLIDTHIKTQQAQSYISIFCKKEGMFSTESYCQTIKFAIYLLAKISIYFILGVFFKNICSFAPN